MKYTGIDLYGKQLITVDAPDASNLVIFGDVAEYVSEPAAPSIDYYWDTLTSAWVAIPAQTSASHVWDWPTHAWVIDFATMQAGMVAALDARRTTAYNSGITYGGNPYASDYNTRINHAIGVMASSYLGLNSLATVTVAVCTAQESHWDSCDTNHASLYNEIMSAVDMTELAAIDINAGWPT